MSTIVQLLIAAASRAWPKPDVFVPPPDCQSFMAGAPPEIGSVLFEAAVEAGITFFTVHGAQHQKLSLTLNWRICRDGIELYFKSCRCRVLAKHGHFGFRNYSSKAGLFGRVPALGHNTANDRKRSQQVLRLICRHHRSLLVSRQVGNLRRLGDGAQRW
jgi:hypothetical protein